MAKGNAPKDNNKNQNKFAHVKKKLKFCSHYRIEKAESTPSHHRSNIGPSSEAN